jgi:DNA repair and recombination protein RAD52
MTTPSRPPNARQLAASAAASRALPAGPTAASNSIQAMQPPTNHSLQSHVGQNRSLPLNDQQHSSNDIHHSSSSGISPQHFAPQPPHQQFLPSNAPQQIPPVGFYSARAAPHVNSDSNAVVPSNIPKFDPHAESPSIRKTAGIDHNKTIPVKRGLAGVSVATTPAVQDGIPPRTNPPRDFVNPSTDMHRRIGAPGVGMQSPGSMTGSAYKPPTRRGPDPNIAGGLVAQNSSTIRRAPLGDVSNVQQSTTGISDGSDAKRQRVTGPENGSEGNCTASAR